MIFEGYSYFQNCKTNQRVYWLCSKNRLQKCNARIITSPDLVILKMKKLVHNHGPDDKREIKVEEF